MTNVAEEGAKRSSIEKLPLREESAFERLPDEIIEHILQLTSPNGFASLIVLNSKWRMVSQQAHLYALHLSRCPSYSAAHRTTPIPDDEDSLPKLRRLFAREIKCNLFEAYLRPQETIINLVSTSISSSSAPGGEAFHFSLSPRGHYVLAYSSSRIHVIDVTGPDITVKRELKIVRRPVSTTITDDGALLAVLSTDLQVNLYDLTGEHPKRTRAVELDYSPRTIALSPMGSVLAAAYDSGVEVSSLDPDFARIERRAVKCYAAESLSFSKNGTQLLGTTTQSQNPSTVVLTAPYYDPSNLPEENVSTLWTTSILFPNGSRDCSHATLLPSPTADEASWTFTYDRVFETFRAVRIDDLRNGTTYFTGPTSDSLSKLVPSTLPTASETGDLVSAGFQGSIWLYGVPEDLEALPNNSSSTDSNVGSEPGTPSPLPRRRNSAPSLRSVDRQNSVRTPQWKLLCDRARNTFVEGRKISSLERVNAMTWVNDNYTSFHKERLVAVAPGVTSQPIQMEDDGMNPVDGGRISILDFDYSLSNGGKSVITIEVGAEEPDVLEEEHRDIDAEVALVRRRTVAQKRGTQNSVARSATAAAAAAARATARPPVPPVPNLRALGDPFTPPSPRRSSITSNDNSETVSIDEGEALDAPYSHTSPRSAPTLRRAATAAAVNRRLHPRAVAGEHIEFRRADGREEHPHESDADNWVPPPPPYTKDAVPPLPEHIQRSILAEAAAAAMQRTNAQRPPNLEFLDLDARPLQRSRTTASVSSNGSRREHGPFTPARSDSTARPIGSLSLSQGQRPVTSYTSQASPEFDDLYDVSPPGSPGPMARMAPPTPPTPLMRPSPQQPSPPSPPTRAPPAPPTPPTPLTPQALSVDEAAEPNISPVSASTAPSIRNIPRRPVGTSTRNIGSGPSPSMDKKVTMQQSFSPIPQPIPRPLDSRLLDWETKTTANEGPASKTRLTPPALNITEEGSDQESTPRPSEDHITRPVLRTSIQRRAVEPQPAGLSKRSVTAPVMTSPSSAKQDPVPIQYRTNTAPVSIQLASSSSTSSASPQMIMPRADQLARLNSRRGRPAGVTDPWRSSGLFNQPRAVSSADNFTWNHGQHAAAPPGAEYRRQGSSSMRPNTTYLPSSRHNIPSPAVPELKPLSISNSNVRQGLPESHLQPPMPHLETIHSVNSEPSPWVSKPMAVGVSRQPSRAERSAAKNIKDAKKRGWRGMKKDDSSKRKEKRFDVASSAGWSDVPSMPSDVRDWQDYKAKKAGKKCRVM